MAHTRMSAIAAPSALGIRILNSWIRRRKSTTGLPTSDITAAIRIYATICLKYHKASAESTIASPTKKYLREPFMGFFALIKIVNSHWIIKFFLVSPQLLLQRPVH
jgi:hypothetical protein